jgi:hypothetical protein
MQHFKLEKDLCAAFSETLPKDWTAYNETAGYDMVLVHKTGAQLGVEAKLVLNPKVLVQVCETHPQYHRPGPDFRAVLVGKVTNPDLVQISKMLGITILTVSRKDGQVSSYDSNSRTGCDWFSRPELPKVEPLKEKQWGDNRRWIDCAPIERLKLPEYVPDVIAGDKAPVVMGAWKIKAMKVCVWVEANGKITRANFKSLGIDPSRWMTGDWLKKGEVRGEWIAGPSFPGESFKKLHSRVYDEITSDLEKWSKEAGLA